MSDSLKDKYIAMAENRDDFNHINNKHFMLPTMGEMIQEDLMSEILEDYVSGDFEQGYKVEEKEKLDASFFKETPFTLTPGYYSKEGAFVLKVTNPSQEKWRTDETPWKLNKYDGDTLDFQLNNIDDGNESFTLFRESAGNLKYKNFKDFFKKMGGGESIQIRFVGIDAAEIPHYEIQPVSDKNKKAIITTTYKDMIKLQDKGAIVLYERCPYYDNKVYTRNDNDEVKLLYLGIENGKETYTEIISRFNGLTLYTQMGGKAKSDHKYYVVIAKEESESNKIADGYAAQAAVKKLVQEASEIMLVLNANGITANKNSSISTSTKTFNSIYYFPEVAKYMMEQWNTYYGDLPVTNYNYIPVGMDNYKRSLGVIYVKHNGEWINLSKYVICKTEMTIEDPKFNNSPELQQIGSGMSDSFNLWSYHRDNIDWLDSFSKISKNSYKERIELHRKLTGIDFTQARDCALLIGDTLMLIPPESIRNVTQLSYERIPNMRSKGTMAKDKGNSEQILEITLYFYEDTGINGIKHTCVTPNGTTMTYYMNGLRSLIAQFKIAPFLPIENGYINDVLGIEAVALQNLSIQNVEGYPRLLKVILTLKNFNYRVFMPDMPTEDSSDGGSVSQMNPMFAKCFNWDIFRYYYQRSIMAGDSLTAVELNGGFASYDYNRLFYSHKNSVGRFLFCGEHANKGDVSFYIPDENWLNNALQVKKQRDETTTLTDTAHLELSDNAKAYIQTLAKLTNEVNKIKNGENQKFNVAIDNFIGKAIKGEQTVKLDIPSSLSENRIIDSSNAVVSYIYINRNGKIIADEKFRSEIILPLKTAFMETINNPNYLTDVNIIETINKNNADIYNIKWDFAIKLNTRSVTDEDWRTIKELLSKNLNLTSDKVFENNTLKVSYTMSFYKGKKSTDGGELVYNKEDSAPLYPGTLIATSSNEYAALSELIAHIENDSDISQIENDHINEYNQEIDFYVKDYKNPANMPFVPYLENVLCRSVMSNMSNSFTEVNLKAIEGQGPQYMGGQDTQLQLELITDDIAVVGALNALPTLASATAKKFRRILPAWPIKIKSDLTRLLGISEVLIDMIEVSTLEGYPGVYSIAMRLTSVDRTQRQREALRRLDVAPNGGKEGYNYNADLGMKNYFALDAALASTELYPDLDLPTISELSKLGYRFVKYSGQNRSYPDPDFYITYNYPYTSLLIKKIVKDVLSENLLNPNGLESYHSFKFADVMGSELVGKIEAYTGLSLTKDDSKGEVTYTDIMNDLEEKIMANLENKKGLTKENKKQIVNIIELTAALKKLIMADLIDGWELKPGWKAPLAELPIEDAMNKLKDTPNAYAQEILDRRKKAINLIDEILAEPLEIRDMSGDNVNYKTACEQAVNTIFNKNDKGKELIKLLCPTMLTPGVSSIPMDEKFGKTYFGSADPLPYLVGYLFASGCALSAESTYDSKIDKKEWYPSHYNTLLDMPSKDENKTSEYYGAKLPYCVVESVNGSPKIGVSIENDIANGTVFGAWRINKYSNPDLIVDMVEKESKAQCVSDIKNVYKKVKPGFLDPYYNKAGKKKIEQYKKTILLNIQSNAEAFLRNVLLYLRKMICDGLIISEIDIVAKDFDTIYADLVGTTATQPNTNVFSPIRPGTISSTPLIEALKELGFDNKELDKLLQDIKISACRSFCARLVYPFLMAITQNSDEIYSMYKSRDYSALNGMIGYVENGGNITESRVEVIKFLSALGGINLTLVNSTEKQDTVSASQKYMNSLLKDIFIEASEDPRTYLLHSFYDMLCNDKRGRLVRAFPTYYIVFVDEGRKMGSWKLHDNFYNMNSISSINVVKSRKIATDVCTIVMNNTFNSYTMEADSTTTQQYTDIYGLRDVFDSIFSPKAYFEKEKRIRLRKTIPDTVVLQPGIRIHVRMGYSGDGSKLPIVFNGKVAELDVNEVATIVAQGDGHELMNPLNAFGEIEALSLDPAQSKITWFKDFRGSLAKGGESPRDLLAKVLTAKYGGLKKWIDTTFDGRWFNDNPFGIMHFGDPKFIDIFEQGELVQNLYEVADSTLLKGINEFATATTSKKITPTINTSLQDKTFWDLLHLAANSGTGYIGAIRDFGMRSTVFLGKPNHYYAYAYELVDNKIIEKRKPFQQFHYFDSYTDIVYNSIKASEAQMKTNAVGIWQSTNFWWGREESTVGPIYLDMNIYPEYQKSMTVDTGLLGSGNGGIDLNFTTHFGEKWSTNANDDKVNKSLAWRVTANTLRDSVKDMYQGDICVLGDPSVKPYDRVYIHDTYEDMMGMFEVEAVIHNMSAETGFTTSVMPDVIARHEDTFETSVQSLMNTAGGMLRLGVALPIINKLWATAVHGKLATVIGKSNVLYNKSNKLAEMARNFSEVTGMKDFLDDKPTAKALFKSLDIFPDIESINLEGFNDAIKHLSKLDASNISKYDDLATALMQFNKLDSAKYTEAIKKAYANNKFGAAQANYTKEQLDKILDTIKVEKESLDKFVDLSKFNHKQFADDILKVTVDNNKLNQLTSLEVKKIIDKWTAEGATASLDDIAKVIHDPEILKAINSKALKVDSVDDFFKTFKQMFSKVDGDNITTFAKAAKKLKGGAFLDDLIYVFKGLVKTN